MEILTKPKWIGPYDRIDGRILARNKLGSPQCPDRDECHMGAVAPGRMHGKRSRTS